MPGNNQPTRRTFFGGLSAILFGCFIGKKLPALPLLPKPQALPTTASLYYSASQLPSSMGNTTTFTYYSPEYLRTTLDSQRLIVTIAYDGKGRIHDLNNENQEGTFS